MPNFALTVSVFDCKDVILGDELLVLETVLNFGEEEVEVVVTDGLLAVNFGEDIREELLVVE